METGVNAGILVPIAVGVVVFIALGFFIQGTASVVVIPGTTVATAAEDCKAACRQWQECQLVRSAADRAVEAAQALADAAKARTTTAFWLQIAALPIYVGLLLNPLTRIQAMYALVLYLAAIAYYLVCIGAQERALKDLADKVKTAQEAYNNEIAARSLVLNACTPAQADDCLAHPQPG